MVNAEKLVTGHQRPSLLEARRYGPPLNGQRHGLRGTFQSPWKGDRWLRCKVVTVAQRYATLSAGSDAIRRPP